LTKITRKKSGRHAMNGLLCSWPQSKNRLKPLLFKATKNGGITPAAYVDSNLVGFANILEGCRHSKVKHLVYASSSSVYGANSKKPFSVHTNAEHPISLYAATKKANELMAHSYSHLYDLPSTGLRLFTVYGPWDRPDMALQKFTRAILAGKPITIYNYGKHQRDFTYIDDIVAGIIKVLEHPAEPNPVWSGNTSDPASSMAPWRIYNIGNNQPVKLFDFIETLENALGMKAHKNLIELKPGDMPDTDADITDFADKFGYNPNTSLKDGINEFAKWYKSYYR